MTDGLTDIEKVELAIHRVLAAHSLDNGVKEALSLLAQQLAEDEKDRKRDGEKR